MLSHFHELLLVVTTPYYFFSPSPLKITQLSFFWKVLSLLQFYFNNPLQFIPLPSSHSGKQCTSSHQLHISQFPTKHMPKSPRGTNWERIWDWSGAARFSLASQVHTDQSFGKTNRIDKYCSNVDINLGLSSSSACRNLDIFETSISLANLTE